MIRLFHARRRLLLLFLVGAAACGFALNSSRPLDPSARKLAGAGNDFGFRLLHRLDAEQPQGNVFFAPFSVSQALMLAMNGAGGQTRKDMAQTLGLGTMPQAQINTANALLLPSLTHPEPLVQVSVANALWANRGTTFSATFQEQSRRFYNAKVTALDFGSPAAVETINGWVSKNTQGKITEIVEHSDIADAKAVLTNAVYFHGKWQEPFDKSDTQDSPFTLSDGKTKAVPLMSQDGSFAYLDTPQFQAVSLPYGTGHMSLYVFLPKRSESLDTLVSGVNSSSASHWFGTMQPTRMTILLPRFRADFEATLDAPLSALGMGSVFRPQADFKPMGLSKGFIGAIIHKAVLEVDEEGTVAAAATGVTMRTEAVPIRPAIVMRVDHPFFCMIRDNTTGAVLFEGIIRDPQ